MDRTFIKITNKDIYNKIETLATKESVDNLAKKFDGMAKSISESHECNAEDHEKINGTLGLYKWMIFGATGVALTAITWLWAHVSIK